jgi:hypothetical protein
MGRTVRRSIPIDQQAKYSCTAYKPTHTRLPHAIHMPKNNALSQFLSSTYLLILPVGCRVGRWQLPGRPLRAWPCIRISIHHTYSIMHERVLIEFIVHDKEHDQSLDLSEVADGLRT